MRDRDYGREKTELQYAGFWKRFFAMLIDGAVTFPFTVFFIFLEGLSPEIAIFVAFPNLALYWFYNIYFHGRWGATLGKMVTGIIVIKASNYSDISFREAIMRFVVDFIFATILLVARITALLHIRSGEYADLGWQDRSQIISDHSPVWLPMSLISNISLVWIYSELLILLLNQHRRAIHDYIAGTVVIHKETQPYQDVPDKKMTQTAIQPLRG